VDAGHDGRPQEHLRLDQGVSETDFTEDLKQFTIPTLIIHGDDDQVVPIDAAGRASKTLVPHATLIVYPGAPHGLTETHKDQVNADLLAFIRE
jgi:non-heme chloroperoxidase